MPKIVYLPVPDGRFTSPTLTPGQVIEVSHDEAEHLLATGAFQRPEPKPVPEVVPEVAPEGAAAELESVTPPAAKAKRGRA